MVATILACVSLLNLVIERKQNGSEHNWFKTEKMLFVSLNTCSSYIL
jgi:hypothetical protein